MKHSTLFSVLMPTLMMLLIGIVAAICVTLAAFYLKLKVLAAVGDRSGFLADVLSEILGGKKARGVTFKSQKTLMTDVEQEMFRRLVKALPDYYVFTQVAFSQFLYTDGGSRNEKFGTMATMKQKVADFVVCGPRFDMVAVIELDDSSHDRQKDAKRDAVLREAGLKPVRWHVSRMPDAAQIRWDVLGLKDGPETEQISRWAPRPT